MFFIADAGDRISWFQKYTNVAKYRLLTRAALIGAGRVRERCPYIAAYLTICGLCRQGFECEPQKRARLKLDTDRHNGICRIRQPEAEGHLVRCAKVADHAAER